MTVEVHVSLYVCEHMLFMYLDKYVDIYVYHKYQVRMRTKCMYFACFSAERGLKSKFEVQQSSMTLALQALNTKPQRGRPTGFKLEPKRYGGERPMTVNPTP